MKYSSLFIQFLLFSLVLINPKLDTKLTFKQHINYVIDKANTATKILYSLINRRSRLDINSKLLLYKVAIRPIICYASPIFFHMAHTHHKKLQTLQNKLLRMILNVPWDTSTSEIHIQTNILKL